MNEITRLQEQLVKTQMLLKNSDERQQWLTRRLTQEQKAHAESLEALEKHIRAEHLFRAVGNTMPFGVFVTDIGGRPNYVSESFLNLIGMSIEDYRAGKWSELIHPDDRSNVTEKWRDTVAKFENWSYEYRIFGRDGNLYTIMSRASPFRDENNKVIGYAGVNFDITDRRLAEDRLRQSEASYRQIVDIASEGIWRMDMSGRTTFANGSILKILGYSKEELEETSIWDLVEQQCLPDFHKAWHKIANSEQQKLDCAFRCKKGNLIWGYISLAPIRNHYGIVDGTLALFTDVSERHTAEENLKHAKQKADAASLAKSQFLANMSHEIRTPLTAVLGFAELLADDEQSNEDRGQCVDAIQRNGKLLLDLINDILDLSKVESGRLEIEPLRFSIQEVAEELASTFKPLLDEKELKLNVTIDQSIPPYISSDPTRVRQILINILGNAFKFTRQGEINVRFSLHENRLRVLVADTGPGMTQGASERLFTPFMQADSSVTRRYGGTGLGLVLSRRLARTLGGDVRLLHTEINQGSIFEIELPIDLPCAEASSDRKKSTPVVLDKLKGTRVLVVDDSPDNRVLISRMLVPYGIRIAQAANGKEGVQMALSGKYDLVFMDIQMPVLNGYDATQQLRDAGFLKPIVALTAHAMKPERDRAIKAGCNAHLSKPLNKHALLETVWELTKH
jgi:PAS domain S-box-containing protein